MVNPGVAVDRGRKPFIDPRPPAGSSYAPIPIDSSIYNRMIH